MSQFGYLKLGVASPFGSLANPKKNAELAVNIAKEASKKGISMLFFPQLSLTGCSASSLFFNDDLISEVEKATKWIASELKSFNICCIVGVCVRVYGKLFNAAAVIFKGRIWGLVVDLVVDNNSFNRTFAGADYFSNSTELCSDKIIFGGQQVFIGSNLIFKVDDAVVKIQFDLESNNNVTVGRCGINLICCLTSYEFDSSRCFSRQISLSRALSINSGCAVVAVNPGLFESSANVIYLGYGIFVEDGNIIKFKKQKTFSSLVLTCDIDVLQSYKLSKNRVYNNDNNLKFVRINNNDNSMKYIHIHNSDDSFKFINLKYNSDYFKFSRKIYTKPFLEYSNIPIKRQCLNIFNMQALALARRILHIKPKRIVIGLSGGLDSTLALLVAVEVCIKLKKNPSFILGVFMPGFGTSIESKKNVYSLVKLLHISFKNISIVDACKKHFKDIGHKEDVFDITFENSQARERSQILFDLANKVEGLVIGTSNLSEIALGFSTFAGDNISHYGVNSGVCKTVIREIIKEKAANSDESLQQLLLNILKMPISPELINDSQSKAKVTQKTEDIIGPYLLHDFFLFYFVVKGFSVAKIKFLASKAFDGIYSKKEISKTLRIFLNRIISQQFKRSVIPDGVNVMFSKRGWSVASDLSVDFFDNLC